MKAKTKTKIARNRHCRETLALRSLTGRGSVADDEHESIIRTNLELG